MEPARVIAGAVLRVWFTWWRLAYLRRDDVQAVHAEALRRASESGPPTEDDDGRW